MAVIHKISQKILELKHLSDILTSPLAPIFTAAVFFIQQYLQQACRHASPWAAPHLVLPHQCILDGILGVMVQDTAFVM